jgi:hypothetical protein
MRPTEIQLSKPFKEVLANLLTLPSTHAETDEIHFPDTTDLVLPKSAKCDAEVNVALRSLYEAAHGRQVETQIGFVAIAPPVAGFLKETPYYVATRYEFFLEAFTRILIGDSLRKGGTNSLQKPDSKRVTNRRGMTPPAVIQERREILSSLTHHQDLRTTNK